ncbi:hypothetical protein NPIL_237601 [Nephila pilipes]|uniref:Uncharacterized protein n=1 Tax=Nephila pilipes TaxID=299642 RepID=A0A8X6NQ77_NEPPI|nr:hypothetical protein NPIL_237601 [Nephila pilipes]
MDRNQLLVYQVTIVLLETKRYLDWIRHIEKVFSPGVDPQGRSRDCFKTAITNRKKENFETDLFVGGFGSFPGCNCSKTDQDDVPQLANQTVQLDGDQMVILHYLGD